MNLLVLSSWFPYPPGNGSRIRAWFLLRELVRAGHTVRLVAGLQDDVAGEKDAGLAALRELGVAEIVTVPWKWFNDRKAGKWGIGRAALSSVPRFILETPNAPLSQAIKEQLAHPTDAVLVMEMGMDAYLPPPKKTPNVPFILDGVEFAETLRLAAETWGDNKRTLLSPDTARWYGGKIAAAKKAKRYWAKRLKRYAAVSAVSAKEAEAVGSLVPTQKDAVIPNGVDVRAYEPRDWSAVKKGYLIYNGSPDYGPNFDAVAWFGQNVLSRVREAVPEACLWVTGKHSVKKAAIAAALGSNVYLSGFVQDLQPFLEEAAVCVVPLQSGGGTRLKILEAWAAGIPVVSTTIGAAGLDGAVPGTHFLQADTPDDFADATVRLLTDAVLCRTLSGNARKLAAERYDWVIVGEKLNKVLLETCRANIPS